MKHIVIIPSRWGSTRFPGKPLAKIAGKPMIQRVVEASRLARGVSDVVVATDDRRIADAVEGFGGRAVMTSPDNRSGTDRAGEAARRLGLDLEDVVVNVQGDQPMMDPRCVEQVLEPLIRRPDLSMTTLAVKITNPGEFTNPKDVKVVMDHRGRALYFSRSPIPFGRDPETVFDAYKHLGVYAYPRRFLETFMSLPEGRLEAIEKLEQLRALEYGYAIAVVITPHDSPEVDVPEDIVRIERRLREP